MSISHQDAILGEGITEQYSVQVYAKEVGDENHIKSRSGGKTPHIFNCADTMK